MPVRVVVDTNVIVSGVAFPAGGPFDLMQQWRNGQIRLVTCGQQVDEIEEVLSRPKFARKVRPEDLQEVLYLLHECAERIDPVRVSRLSRDPDDDIFLAVAMVSGAEYLVTGDKDILTMAGDPAFRGFRILSPRQFLLFLEGHQ